MNMLPEERLSKLVADHIDTAKDIASCEDQAKSASASITEIANNSELKADEAVGRVIKANGLKLLFEARATAKRQALLKIEAEIRVLIPACSRRLKEVSGNDPFLVIPDGLESNLPVIDQARDLVRRFGKLEAKV